MKKYYVLISLLLCVLFVKGQFGNMKEIAVAIASPQNLICFDMDNDGDLDVLSSSQDDNKIAWYENLGSGNFGRQRIISMEEDQPTSVQTGDLDNDGDLDVLTTSFRSDKISWYENKGNGSFGTQQIITTLVNNPEYLYTNDMDNDGDVDVVSASYSDDKIAWYENLGGGTFGVQQIISSSANMVRFVYGEDLDNDGDIDLISASRDDDKIAWYENLGGGNFSSEIIISINADYAMSVYATDMDNDGNIDVISASSYDNKVAWYKNLGGGIIDTVPKIISTSSKYAKSVYVADLDNDGDGDVLSGYSGHLVWHENLGGGIIDTTQNPISLYLSIYDFVYAGDLDNDGDIDVLFSSESRDKIAWHENLGGGSFGTERLFVSDFPQEPYSIHSADMDNDGDIDIVSASRGDGEIAWYENLGEGDFGIQVVISKNSETSITDITTSVYVDDMDNDGDIDVLFSSALEDKIAWHENIGGGVIDTNQIIISQSADYAHDVHTFDVDNDGDRDVLSASKNDDKIAWYENLGGGVIDTNQNIISSIDDGPVSLCSGDLNNDGLEDVICALNIDDEVVWYENLGGGVFGLKQIIANHNGASSVAVADIDNDGDLDVACATSLAGSLFWYENIDSATSFVRHSLGALGDPTDIHLVDTDNDGDIDVIYSSEHGINSTGSVHFLENNGSGGFIKKFNSYEIINGTSVHAADVDNDGDVDILSSSWKDNRLSWFENYFVHAYQLHGNIFFDLNQDGVKDSTERGLSFIQIQLQPSELFSYSNDIGNYVLHTDTGTFTLGYASNTYWSLTTDSVTYTPTISKLNPVIDSLDFGFYPDTIFTLIEPELTGSLPRCNDSINYWISIRNKGTTIPNGIIHLELDDSISYISSKILPDSIVGQNIYWSYDSLFFFSEERIGLSVLMPPFTSMGDTLASVLKVNQLDSMNSIVYTNRDTLEQILVCAYDPNDKLVDPKGEEQEGYVSVGQELEYLIRFQNTGNDTAFTVMIRDQLDSDIDWSTMEPIASSHPMQVYIEQDGEAVFKFENIMLPDSGADFLGSQGFVKFKIQQKAGLVAGTPIFNTGHIYFDFNPAVITNTVLNTIDTNVVTVSVKELTYTETKDIIVFPNPFTEHVTIYSKSLFKEIYDVVVYDMMGKEVMRKKNITTNKVRINLNGLTQGYYILTGIDKSGKKLFSEKVIKN